MSSSKLYRLSGVGLLIGGLIAAIGSIGLTFLNDNLKSPLWVPFGLLVLVGEMIFLTAIPGVYIRQAKQIGIPGLIGFVMYVFSGLLIGIGASVMTVFIFPWLGQSAPAALANGPDSLNALFAVGGILGTIGGILFSIVTLRAGIFSRLAATLFIGGNILNFAQSFLASPLIGGLALAMMFVSLAWFGVNLISEQNNDLVSSPAPGAAGA